MTERATSMATEAVILVTDMWQRFRWRLAALVLLMVVNAFTEVLTIALIFPLLQLVDIGEGGGAGFIGRTVAAIFPALGLPLTLPGVLAMIGLLVVVQASINITLNWNGSGMVAVYVEQWRRELLKAFLDARWRFFLDRRQGDLFHAIINETDRMAGAFNLAVTWTANSIVALVFTGFAFAVSWQITLALIGGAVVIWLVTRPVVRGGARIGQMLTESGSICFGLINDFLANAKLIKGTATEDAAMTRFADAYTPLRIAFFRSLFQPHLLRVMVEASGILLLCGLLAAGHALFSLDAAVILVVLAVFVRLYPKVSALLQNVHQLHISLPAMRRARAYREDASALAEPVDRRSLPAGFGRSPVTLRLDRVTAGYQGRPVLHGIDLDIPAGEIVAIVGPSGAGKSTLIDCLLHLVDAQGGTIRVDDVALDDLPLAAWRRRVAYVAQDTLLLHATVAENLRWGHPDLDDAAMQQAARDAGAHDFIVAMPHGYDTTVGDRGMRMSGGQRQRLGLARALAGDPALLILDEATSALDAETEAQVMQNVAALRGRVTTVLVTHRLATARVAHRVYVMEAGKVIETGSWQDLAARSGAFSRALEVQRNG